MPAPELDPEEEILRDRPFELEPGDKIVGDFQSWTLMLVKQTGESIDLNAMRVDPRQGSNEMFMRPFDHPMAFLHLCSILAASYRLSSHTFKPEGKVYSCLIQAPRSPLETE